MADPARPTRRARLSWPAPAVVALLLLAGCTGPAEPPAAPGAPPTTAASAAPPPAQWECGTAGRADRQAGAGPRVAVQVHVWRDRVGVPADPKERVGAFPAGKIPKGFLETDRCLIAIATVAGNGTATLWLQPGLQVAFATTAHREWHGALTPPVAVREGLQVDAFTHDTALAEPNDCGQPTPPATLPDRIQFARDLVAVEVQLWLNRPGVPADGADVAALAGAEAPDSRFGLDRFFNDCVLAHAKTDAAGKATLWLHAGQEYWLGAARSIEDPATRGPFTAAAGPVVAFAHLPEDQPLNACGLPTPPWDLPDNEALGTDVVEVRLRLVAVPDATPLGDVQVGARPPSDAKLRAGLDAKRFFNGCILADARTDAEGRATLWLPPGAPLDLVVDARGAAAGEVVRGFQPRAGEVVVASLPRRLDVTLAGAIQSPAERVAVPLAFDADPAAAARYLDRIDGLRDAVLAWTNAPTGWGDLYADLALGDGTRLSDGFFNEQQGPLDGAVTEDLRAVSLFGHECDARREGVRFEAYSPTQRVVAVEPLPFTLAVEVELSKGPDFHDPFSAC